MSGGERTDEHRVLFFCEPGYTLPNFAATRILWKGKEWATSEHIYQAERFPQPGIQEWIREAPTPHEAMARARKLKGIQRSDWDAVKVSVMEQAVRAKLAQHEYVRIELLRTGNKELIENSPTDGFWGRGPDWKGRNELGKLLMKLREELVAGTFKEC